MDAMVLPYDMFDDGSIECRNFQVANLNDEDDCYICEWDYIKNNFPAYVDVIRMAVSDLKPYINVKDIDGNEFELSWD
jgi:hypothetical protein